MTGKWETLKIQKKNFKAGRGNVDWFSLAYGWLENKVFYRTFHVTNDKTVRVFSHVFLFIQ